MDFNPPLIITNFKTFQEGSGAQALELAKLHERLAQELKVNLVVAGQALDVAMLATGVSLPVLAQHVDPVGYGAFTGHTSVDALKTHGVDGSLLNHSERRISEEDIAGAIGKLKEFGMFSVVCAETVEEGMRFMKYGPDFIAIEPSELIGGDLSVSSARPELISDAVKQIGRGRVLVGAGIKNGADVKRAMELGASGILVASGVVRAKDQMAALRDLCLALQ